MTSIQKHNTFASILIFTGLIFGGFLFGADDASAAIGSGNTYNPTIHTSDFSTVIDNKYFSLPIGLKTISRGETDEGTETVKITITGKTKMIMGIKTLVYHDEVFLDGELIEDTEDYLAQDTNGNVWYFGENVDNYEDGELKDHDGSWIAGVDGAKPGIWMKANPVVGDTYRQEYYKGEAEDIAEVLSLSGKVAVPAGTFTQCLKTLDSNPLESGTEEYKYYCPKVRGLALEVEVGGDERVELISTTIEGTTDSSDPEIAKLQLIIKLLNQLIALLIQQRDA